VSTESTADLILIRHIRGNAFMLEERDTASSAVG
jgi:hypothetical protein